MLGNEEEEFQENLPILKVYYNKRMQYLNSVQFSGMKEVGSLERTKIGYITSFAALFDETISPKYHVVLQGITGFR